MSDESTPLPHELEAEFKIDVPMEASPHLIDAPNYHEFAQASVFGKAVFNNAHASLTHVHALYSNIEVTEHFLIHDVIPGTRQVYVREGGYGAGRMITPNDKAHEYQRDLTTAYKGVLGRVQEKLNQMENVATELTKKIDEVVKDTSTSAKGIALAAEIRAHMKGLKSEDQYDQSMLMHEMITQGNKAGVAAILDAPPFLSGMTAEEQAEYRQIAKDSWAPEETQQLNMTRRLIKVVQHATEELHARYHISQAKMEGRAVTTFSRRLAELRGMA